VGAGSTVAAVQQQPPSRLEPSPAAPPSIATSLARLTLQLGDRDRLTTLLAELVDAVEEMREGGPLRIQVNVRPDVRPPTQPKVASVAIQRDERLW
jgi:hypothetical protein